ncbi:hypothetical protein BD410DRAFT_503372 [Rickenella mellea]|uniref:Uncharacterized protein n=1 Tax=Rickenella mellea TaxID=50990 RepID=A0A4Y7PSK2_9AGAM|nr:hypothetical protein BD410DRAFT_503372 [Rickenella mellea]
MQTVSSIQVLRSVGRDLQSSKESGDTMRAAGIHAIATVPQTEVGLIISSTPKHRNLTPLISRITRRIAGVISSNWVVVSGMVECRMLWMNPCRPVLRTY